MSQRVHIEAGFSYERATAMIRFLITQGFSVSAKNVGGEGWQIKAIDFGSRDAVDIDHLAESLAGSFGVDAGQVREDLRNAGIKS